MELLSSKGRIWQLFCQYPKKKKLVFVLKKLSCFCSRCPFDRLVLGLGEDLTSQASIYLLLLLQTVEGNYHCLLLVMLYFK